VTNLSETVCDYVDWTDMAQYMLFIFHWRGDVNTNLRVP
jgi:hypothetical protein